MDLSKELRRVNLYALKRRVSASLLATGSHSRKVSTLKSESCDVKGVDLIDYDAESILVAAWGW